MKGKKKQEYVKSCFESYYEKYDEHLISKINKRYILSCKRLG